MTKKLKKLTSYQLFLPLVCVLLVLAVNIVYDISQGNDAFNFFHIAMTNGMLQGRLITILNRGSEVAILCHHGGHVLCPRYDCRHLHQPALHHPGCE